MENKICPLYMRNFIIYFSLKNMENSYLFHIVREIINIMLNSVELITMEKYKNYLSLIFFIISSTVSLSEGSFLISFSTCWTVYTMVE